MSKKANPALIGFFIVTALTLAVAAIIILKSGKLFAQTDEFILFFDESIAGLDIGAPVEYGGVQIGTVSDLYLECNEEQETIRIPVFIEIDRNRIQYTQETGLSADLAQHLHQGLQAQLQLQSFLTGKLKIMLTRSDRPLLQTTTRNKDIAEIQTVPSLLKNIETSFDELPLVDILDNLDTTIRAVAEIADSGEIPLTLQAFRTAAQDVSTLTSTVDLQNTILALNTLLEKISENVNPVAQDMGLTLEELRDAAQSARYLIDYLQRHPESLIQGKGTKQP